MSEDAVAEQVRAACLTSGFFYLANHGIDEDLSRAVFEANRRFHERPLADKQLIKLNHWHRGYQGFGTSKLVSSARFASAATANQLESFFLRHEVPSGDPDYLTGALKGPNQWPDDEAFRDVVSRYDVAVRDVAMKLLPVFGLAVGEDRDFFLPYFQRPSTALRLIHYPPAADDQPTGSYGIHPHTDYGFITILAQDKTGGLEIQRPGGGWMPAPVVPDTLIINIGDALARWTNDVFNSTPHRVISPTARTSRYSVAMFFDPDVEADIRCLKQFTDATHPARHQPIRYGDYFQERLNSNYPDRTEAAAAVN
ncbi:MAG: isopenicillin N synthase family oxygenase [Rhodospirillaceae bacterium]|nr:isopenicillin N synthase family oxygenase [Rhodospirillaceae bacterium]MBT5192028.1 isopenicillin N synthase family oxygenase [Rhodospirillaceae bacterium]MBT5895732.1 isopenicillin N synthase family oxygenase [Rhodospirillaceae bacterium]MBT7760422.1 isopenicillin N synthase family oxygenase [Rhodospirillaceae bacterium]